jgi:hypothetical protein
LFGGEIPLIRQVTNFIRKLLEEIAVLSGRRGHSIAKRRFSLFSPSADTGAALIREALTPAAISGKRIALLQ